MINFNKTNISSYVDLRIIVVADKNNVQRTTHRTRWHNNSFNFQTKVKDASSHTLKWKRRWVGRILHFNDKRWTLLVMVWKYPMGNRGVGKPRGDTGNAIKIFRRFFDCMLSKINGGAWMRPTLVRDLLEIWQWKTYY